MGSSAKTPAVVTPIPTPAPATTASANIISDAASAAELAAKTAGGASSTILTGPNGLALTNTNPGKTLLG
jgi:hypothetical protein